MTEIPSEGWKVFADGDESENIPLWRALAQFTSEDFDEGLKTNAAVINRDKLIFLRYYNLAFIISLVFGFFFLVFLLAMLVSAHSKSTDALFLVVLALLVITAAPHLWRQLYQYGFKTPDTPLDLPHAADRHFDAFLGYLQKASGPQAYYLSRFGKKRKSLDRRQFFGRLRYFLFSEHSADRSVVMRFRAGLALPSDIYLHRDDVAKMIAKSRPKRKGGPGRNAKYPYSDAVIALIGDPRLRTLDLTDRAAAVRIIRDWLSEWFESNADASGDAPRADQLTPYAEKICDHLKNLASRNAS